MALKEVEFMGCERRESGESEWGRCGGGNGGESSCGRWEDGEGGGGGKGGESRDRDWERGSYWAGHIYLARPPYHCREIDPCARTRLVKTAFFL